MNRCSYYADGHHRHPGQVTPGPCRCGAPYAGDQQALFDGRGDPAQPMTTTGAHHPHTSQEAAERALPNSGTRRRQVLDLLLSVHPDGLTDEQIRTTLGIPFGSALARRNELVSLGWAEDSGDRRATEADATAIIWRAIP